MRVLIIDDEPLARAALANILASRRDVECFDSANDAIEALEKLETNSYDVLLLDIHMPEISGIEFLDRLTNNHRPVPSIIFVTAHEEHAITAFDKHALDYVLKPFCNQRVHESLDIAFRRTAGERANKLIEALPNMQKLLAHQSSRIAIKASGRIVFIDPSEVMTVQAQGNYVLLQCHAGSYLLRESISAVVEKLEPYGFIRIHRSMLVNTQFVDNIRPRLTGEYALRMKGGKEYTVTRTYRKNLKSLAKFWIGTDSFLAT